MVKDLNIFLPVSTAWILLCLALAVLFAFALYFCSKAFKEIAERQRLVKASLGGLRFLAILLIALLLLNPYLRSVFEEQNPPIIALVADNSQSVGQAFTDEDSLTFVNQWANFEESFGDEFELNFHRFGNGFEDNAALDFSGKATDLAGAMKEVADRYYNRNLGAVVVMSDGIYNQGSNPLYVLEGLNAPIYSIAVGDTSPKRDLRISKVYHNDIAYLDDRFEVGVDIQASGLEGEIASIKLQRISPGGLELNSRIDSGGGISADYWLHNERFILDADVPGFHHYRLTATLAGDNGDKEAIYVNNSWDFYVEVLDSRKEILILANSPHPDLTALKQAILTNKNYEVDLEMASAFTGDFEDYALVILHGLPQAGQQGLMDQLNAAEVSRWFILSQSADLNVFNSAQVMLKINSSRDQSNEVSGVVQDDFSLFALPESFKLDVADFPPMTVPFGEYQLASAARVLIKQKIGAVETDFPLLAFYEEFGQKQAVMTGEGLWRWRLYDYQKHGDHETFDDMISKSVQYLSIEVDKRRFRAEAVKSFFSDNEEVALEAQLYNANYEPVNEPEVNVLITREDGTEYPFVFSRSGNMYVLNAGFLPAGNYTFSANVEFDGEQLTADGAFSVKPLNLELVETTADFNLLQLLSERFGGQTYGPNQLDQLAEDLKNSNTIAPQIYEVEKTLGAINFKWLFFLILLLLSVEWFFRKFLGAY